MADYNIPATVDYLMNEQGVNDVMRQVIIALLPGSIMLAVFFGPGIIVNIVLSIIFALALEATALRLRKKPISAGLSDLSAVVTAWLFALMLPPLTPWWITLTGVFFAIIVAKQLYGGLGNNIFNPAMVGYVVLLISWPAQMTLWFPPLGVAQQLPTFLDSISYLFSGAMPDSNWDSLTMATPLDTVKTERSLNRTLTETRSLPIFGSLAGVGTEWVANAYALGGLWLIYKRIIAWQLPLTLILTVGIFATFFSINQPEVYPPATFHIFTPGLMLGAFFIITDPVSGCSSMRGKILFAIGVGCFTYIIRTWGGYPGGVAFAVLLMNMAAPTIDYFIKPRTYGHS